MNGEKNKAKFILFFAFLAIVALVFFYVSRTSNNIKFFSPFSFINPNRDLSVLIVGDIMLDRNVRNRISEVGFDEYFSGIRNLVSKADFSVGNLEGPFTPYPSLTSSLVNKTLTFTFDPTHAPKLFDLGFDIFGLANNHTLNFGLKGLEMTKKYIRDAGMFYYGDPNNEKEISIITAKNGISLGFVGFHEFSYMNFEKILDEIESLRPQADVVIVSPHWGVEYQKEPTDKMRNWAHQFIDRGADVVIGAHPHIVGEIEDYKGKKIFYSLGNFAFDQYFSEDTMNGLAVWMDIKKSIDGKILLSYELIPIRSDKKGTYLKYENTIKTP